MAIKDSAQFYTFFSPNAMDPRQCVLTTSGFQVKALRALTAPLRLQLRG